MGTNNWLTPEVWVERARQVMGSIDVDPCAHPDAYTTGGSTCCYFGPDVPYGTDGLIGSWFGNMFINPPYSMPLIDQFATRIAEHATEDEAEKFNGVKQMVVLVNSKTETAWYHRIWRVASAVCIVKGRIPHEMPGRIPTKTCRLPHTFFYLSNFYNKEASYHLNKFYQVFSPHGIITQ
jgi:hypothetical protein